MTAHERVKVKPGRALVSVSWDACVEGKVHEDRTADTLWSWPNPTRPTKTLVRNNCPTCFLTDRTCFDEFHSYVSHA